MKKRWMRGTAAVLTAALLFTMVPLNAAAAGTEKSALLTQQFNMDKVKSDHGVSAAAKIRPGLGYFAVPVESPDTLSAEYTVSFDYYVPSRTGAAMQQNNFVVWSSAESLPATLPTGLNADSKANGPALLQTGKQLVLGKMSYTSDRILAVSDPGIVVNGLADDAWHHIVIHYTDDAMGVYVDGNLSDSGYYPLDNPVKVKNLGPCGDTMWPDLQKSPTASTGWAYYDNLTLADSSGVAASYSFDDAAGRAKVKAVSCSANDDGSYFMANNTQYSAPQFSGDQTRDPSVLQTVNVKAKQPLFNVDFDYPLTSVLSLSGTMADGTAAAMGAAKLELVPVSGGITLTQKDGAPALRFTQAGQASFRVRLTLEGVTVTSNTVAAEASPDRTIASIRLGNSGETLVVGQKTELTFDVNYTDLTSSQKQTYGDLAKRMAGVVQGFDVTVSGGSADIVKEQNHWYVQGKADGALTLAIAGSVNGRPVSTGEDGKLTVAGLASISVEAYASHVYAGDTTALRVTGVLADGTKLDLSGVATVSGGSVEQKDGVWLLKTSAAGNVALSVSAYGKTGGGTLAVELLSPVKEKSSYYTEEKVKNAIANIKTEIWAQNERDAAVNRADKWLSAYSLSQIWEAVPSQDIPRSFSVNQGGCLVCGTAATRNYGNYPYKFDSSAIDWQLDCPYCGVSFPTNDFAAYYKNGLNSAGEFDAELAAQKDAELKRQGKSNLVNRYADGGLTPEMESHVRQQLAAYVVNGGRVYTDDQIDTLINQMKTDKTWGVDNGMGYGYDPTDSVEKFGTNATYGNPYTFVAYYAHIALLYDNGAGESALYHMANDFSQAYLYTGEQKYADAALVLLDRLADEYPDMQVSEYPHNGNYGFTNSDGHHTEKSRGKLVGSIWESNAAKNFLYAYDAVFPAIDTLSSQAKAVLAEKSHNPKKGDAARIKMNFEDGFLREISAAFDAGDLLGNPGMAQSTLALAAVVIDHNPETQQWLQKNFDNGDSGWNPAPGAIRGNILNIFFNQVNRDGQGDEISLGYNALWLDNWLELAKALDGYKLPQGGAELVLPEGASYDLMENPRFQKMFQANYPLLLTNNYTPHIGDTDNAGGPGSSIINMDELLYGYARLTALDPQGDAAGRYDEMAQAIYQLNGKTAANLRLDIFTANPAAIGEKVNAVHSTKGDLDLGSANLSAYGLGILRDGVDASASTYRGAGFQFYEMQPSLKSDGMVLNTAYLPTVQVEPRAGTENPRLDYDFVFEGKAGGESYGLYLEYFVAKNLWGIYDVYLNDALAATVDFGGGDKGSIEPGAQGVNLSKLCEVTPKAGKNTVSFRFREAGKGDDSASVKFGIRSLYLLEQGLTMPPLNQKVETTQRSMWMFYGTRNASHNHADPLNLGYIAYDLDLMPDFGYPDTTKGSQGAMYLFEKSNLAHNTVGFSTAKDANYYAHYLGYGSASHFDDAGDVKLVHANVDHVQNSGVDYANQFDRVSALVRIDEENSYIVDLFRVEGANPDKEYQYSLHTAEADAGKTQLIGLQGAGAVSTAFAENTLRNVSRYSAAGGAFSVDWSILDTRNRYGNGASASTDVHMKVTMLGAGGYEDVMLGDMIPPQNGKGNAKALPALMVTGKGKTTFLSVIEAYRGQSGIRSVEAVEVLENGAKADENLVRAVCITLDNGRVDYVVNSLEPAKEYLVAGKFAFSGFFGVYSEQDGELLQTYLNDGTQIGEYEMDAAVEGTVSDWTKALSSSNELVVTPNEPLDNPESLVGRVIYVDNSDLAENGSGAPYRYNAAYTILGVQDAGNGKLRLDIGSASPIRGLDTDGKTYLYDFNANAAFRIPLSGMDKVIKEYPLTITAQEGGTIAAGTPGNYAEGTKITLSAAAKPGYVFRGWQSSLGDFENASSAATVYTMPGQAAQVTALFEKEEAKGGSGDEPAPPATGVGDALPATLFLLAAGAGLLCLYRRKKAE